MRAIIAIEPSIPVAERLVVLQEELADPLRMLGAEAVWPRAEELRLVLKTAEMEEAELGHVRATLRDAVAACAPVEFETFGTMFVPSVDTPRLVAVGTRSGAEGVEHLRGLAEAACVGIPSAVDDREWRPWIRVARLKTSASSTPLTGVLRQYSETSYGTSRAVDVVISTTSIAGGRVRTQLLDRLPLGG